MDSSNISTKIFIYIFEDDPNIQSTFLTAAYYLLRNKKSDEKVRNLLIIRGKYGD